MIFGKVGNISILLSSITEVLNMGSFSTSTVYSFQWHNVSHFFYFPWSLSEIYIQNWANNLDHKEGWALKKWCFWTVVLEKTFESTLDCKEIQSVHPKGDQSWVFIGRTGVEAETPILWPPDVKSWLIWKDPDAGKDWRREKGTTEDEMIGWHHWLNVHEFEQILGDGKGQGSLACCSPWGLRVGPDFATEQQQLNDSRYKDFPISKFLFICTNAPNLALSQMTIVLLLSWIPIFV